LTTDLEFPARLGIDTGGTFTDFVWLDAGGQLQLHKEPSTPDDPAEAILIGIAALQPAETAPVVHGSTVATNALLERRGARTALITTAGFADVLAIGRQHRPELYSLVPSKPAPLVPRSWRFEVDERVSAQGEVLRPLDPAGVNGILVQLEAAGIESVAVCTLFSFLYPRHERLIAAAIRDWERHTGRPVHVSLSVDILPEYREFERTATTVINAYVAPLVDSYLDRLTRDLAGRPLTVMQSSGGITSAHTAGEQAARTVLSGPAGGVVGARYVAGLAGHDQIISFDMGGTSTDVALCPGRTPLTSEGEIAGLPLRLPQIDIHTVGAGGGSLATVDHGGALRVGPESAGADPGPACYLEEAASLTPDTFSRPTTTDANLVLGRLDPAHFLGGTMRLNEKAARVALTELARQVGAKSAEAAAWGVIRIANATMERAVRRISVERGHNPADFTLVAFGGAGPLHACDLAAELGIGRVLVPSVPGVLSALGMLVAAPAREYSQTLLWQTDASRLFPLDELTQRYRALAARALVDLANDGYASKAQINFQRRLDMRYAGQSHELSVLLPIEEMASEFDPYSADLAALFDQVHERRHGYRQPEAAVEIVNLRLTATVSFPLPALPTLPLGDMDASAAIIGHKQVWFGGRPVKTALFLREKLRPGNHFAGPAVVFQYDTTTVFPADWTVEVDEYCNLMAEHVR
jgi:N-methylhydantoinase A